jgi:hypothetical protein
MQHDESIIGVHLRERLMNDLTLPWRRTPDGAVEYRPHCVSRLWGAFSNGGMIFDRSRLWDVGRQEDAAYGGMGAEQLYAVKVPLWGGAADWRRWGKSTARQSYG